ncbi:hypothetical protein Scep_013200 [Stephania cephalantha]|uniref:non-specific serine/threonine protein kinase n=1 Tax=Stephania cephalantha TaxID=152367 RepID=A0AAP0P768_9MAGN
MATAGSGEGDGTTSGGRDDDSQRRQTVRRFMGFERDFCNGGRGQRDGTFELGLFTTSTGSQNHYLGIWYKKISPGTVVWVGNRANPIIGNNGVLKLTQQGDLVLLDHNISTIVWYSKSINSTPNEVQNPAAQLLDNGNFVVRNNSGDNIGEFLWQSFDYPFDTLLPGMKLGWDLRTGLNRFLSAQKSIKDVSSSDYALGVNVEGVAQLVLWKGKEIQYRAGSWNGLRFTGTPQLNPNPIFTFNFTYNLDEVYYSYELCNDSVVTELVVNQSGLIHRLTWNDRNRAWILFFVLPSDQCDTFNLCGSHGSCNMDYSPICQCLEGFAPKNARDWSTMDWSGGCVRRTPLECQSGEGFRKYDRIKLPDTRYAMLNASMSFRECEAECSMNCSCTAYAVADIREGSGCLRWFGDLVDMRKLNDNGQEIYIRMAASDLAVEMNCIPKSGNTEEDPKGDIELPIFDFATIATATNNFTFGNKIGEGGFGPVYKGKLCDGLEIAVKRLSRNSHQGLNEFKNEVVKAIDLRVPKKLQHRNLVKLLGCCIQGFFTSSSSRNVVDLRAWKLWRDGNPIELIEESIASSCVPSEVLRCIHVALLCVQHYPDVRPSMPLVSLMLISEATRLPTPKAPGFVRRNLHLTDSSSSFQEIVTTNEMTISLLEPR